jgi:hypothetical protein
MSWWPFKRKPRVTDQRVSTDIRAGDKVECISNKGWKDPHPLDPEFGDVLTVVNIADDVSHRGVRCYYLYFKALPHGYNSQAFRKLVETDDTETIKLIRTLANPKEVEA